MTRELRIIAAAAGMMLLASCSTSPTTQKKSEEPQKAAPPPAPAPAPTEVAPATTPPSATGNFKVRFETSKGPIVVEVHRDWAPLGAQRFEDLIKDKYYDGARFFRIVPNFVVQFGIAGEPSKTKKWDKQFKDDPVKQTNRVGSLAFATMGPNTRTTQVFINLRSNQTLDDQGFAPFAQIVEGMDVVQKLYAGYGERPDQGAITSSGNAYLTKSFPNLDYIKSATIL